MEEKKGRCRRKGGKDYWIFVVGSRENVTRKTRQPLLERPQPFRNPRFWLRGRERIVALGIGKTGRGRRADMPISATARKSLLSSCFSLAELVNQTEASSPTYTYGSRRLCS